MEKPAFISSEKETNPGLDYGLLRAEGVNIIQKLTGAFWTDYNEHDPGVTILELLCYAITDLSYRTQFDIQDHLYNDPEDDTFLKAHSILPCNALTLNDYRKLIFDKVFELKNVWVLPILDDGSSFRGLYKILIDIDPAIKADEDRLAVSEKTRKVFCDNRNICEDLEHIKILDQIDVGIYADIEVDGIRDLESILAYIYFKVDEYLSPEIRFYSLSELLQEGFTLNEIFNGPLLKHGFIKTSELQPKSNKILISEVIKFIMQVPGVVSVKNLHLKVGEKIYENQIEISEDELPKLLTMLTDARGNSSIQFFRGAVNYTTIDFNIVKRKLNELQSANKRVYRLSEETISIPLGKKLNVEPYFSIQNQFPLVYGIGQYGLPSSADTKRKAQAKQLKGFLLIYEQILANYLSQLANVKKLFSLKEDLKETYFYQTLDSVPDVKPLLKERKHEFIDETDLHFSTSLNYYLGLPELVKVKDNYTDRRNRFLDYLLAIHGESYTQYSLSQFNYYFNESEFERHLIQNKTRLLKSLPTINKNRARGFNYLESSVDTDNITGMEAKISILLGLGGSHSDQVSEYKAHSLVDHYRSFGAKLLNDDADDSEKESWYKEGVFPNGLNEEYIEDYFDFIDTDEIVITDFSDNKRKSLLSQTLPVKSKLIPSEFLKEGIILNNYRLGHFSNEGDESFYIAYRGANKKWQNIGNFVDEKDAIAAVMELIAHVKKLNIQSEGLHIIEHILLRPDLKDQNHGVLIYDENRKPVLRSAEQYSFRERDNILKDIKNHLYEFANYSVETTVDKDFEVHFKTPDDKYHFVSMEADISVEATHEKMERLFRFISDQEEITPFERKIGLYIKNIHTDRIIPEDFFSYRASIILPNWTARFGNKEFRAIIEDTIHENKPANISFNCFWLHPSQMQEFETVYYLWMEELRQENPDKDLLDEYSNQLSELLMTYKNE
ncbi:MAG: hypothetical protein J7604_10275 [Sporocytophaga sp.]|uniref:hypothetical protein n=1 Tax=Sporocytophaga sp. TaxID=2231183 RepID=UPI001B29A52F|nr:hypothetical protein [Sporocytophaga sp.]MBO9700584.1 hypothetical protein [Sporocytophaga sp.]